MTAFLSDNWGRLASAVGLVVAIVGFYFAIRRASQARTSADAGKIAAEDARNAIFGVLVTIDLQEAIAIIQRLKLQHLHQMWDASLENYQPLRKILSDINVRNPELPAAVRDVLRRAIPQITVVENNVIEALSARQTPDSTS